MKTIGEIKEALDSVSAKLSEKLSEIRDDLDALGADSGRAAAANTRDELALIEAKALRSPITNKGLASATETARQAYMRFLGAVARGSAAKLEMARRIGAGSGSEWDAERLLAEGTNPPARFAVEIAENLHGLALPLLMDALMVACSDGSADDAEIALVAEAAELLGVSGEDTVVVSRLAAACFAGDEEKFFAIDANRPYPGMSHHIPAEWIGPMGNMFVRSFKFIMNSIAPMFNTEDKDSSKKLQRILRKQVMHGENILLKPFETFAFQVGVKAGDVIEYDESFESLKSLGFGIVGCIKVCDSVKAPLSGLVKWEESNDCGNTVLNIFIRSYFA